jgi:hypothetical protein
MNSANSTRNKAYAKMAIEVLNTGNIDLLDQIARPDFIYHDGEPGHGPGLEGVKVAFTRFRIAFPDLRVTIQRLFSDGDYVIAHEVMEGTNTGELIPGAPPTGKRMKLPVIDIFRFENGRAAERWGVYNQYDMLVQIGVIPPPKV